jgi:hypothetical protein
MRGGAEARGRAQEQLWRPRGARPRKSSRLPPQVLHGSLTPVTPRRRTIMLMDVDLPAPLGPSRPKHSPFSMARFSCRTASWMGGRERCGGRRGRGHSGHARPQRWTSEARQQRGPALRQLTIAPLPRAHLGRLPVLPGVDLLEVLHDDGVAAVVIKLQHALVLWGARGGGGGGKRRSGDCRLGGGARAPRLLQGGGRAAPGGHKAGCRRAPAAAPLTRRDVLGVLHDGRHLGRLGREARVGGGLRVLGCEGGVGKGGRVSAAGTRKPSWCSRRHAGC